MIRTFLSLSALLAFWSAVAVWAGYLPELF